MEKSEIYYMAQIAVLNSPLIAPEKKLEMIRVLMSDEAAAKYWEELQAKKTLETLAEEIAETKTVGVVG